MKTIFLCVVVALLLINFSAASPAAAPPSITISGAVGTNPATVSVTGPSQAINVAWNAGTEYTYCEIYYTTNGANQLELGRGHDGAKPVNFVVGNTYEFWMIVYPGNGQYNIVTKLGAVAKQKSATPPPPPPAGGNGPGDGRGGFGEKATRKSDPIIAARNAPFISDVIVQPDYRNVVISFASTQSTPPLIEIGRVAPSTTHDGIKTFASDSGAFSRFATEQKLRYVLDIDVQGEQLEVGTTYHYIINVFNNDRNAATRKREQISGQFTTLSQTVVIVWQKVYLVDDGDELSGGECYFWFWVNHGMPSQKSTDYKHLLAHTGSTYYPRKGTLVIENAPDILKLHASGWEQDGDNWPASGVIPAPLSGADDHSVEGTGEFDTNAAAQEFDLSKFPGKNRTVQFRLETRGGSLKFIAFGYFDIIRGTAERIGTTSSALKTEPDTIKPQRRVTTPEGSSRSTPLTKCEAAREARAKNNPAAAGLEAQCRDEQALKSGARIKVPGDAERSPTPICESARRAKELNNPAATGLEQKCLASIGAEIVEQDSTLVAAQRLEADSGYKFGFDIATAIFGDPALGAQGNTLTGPGSLRIRGGLNATGQRGFDAALKIHLSRNYKR